VQTIVLASGSPRRRELLQRVGIPFEAVEPRIDEMDGGLLGDAPSLVTTIARRKAESVAARLGPRAPRWVVGVDTVVEVDGRILGKPAGAADAEAMLRLLSGRTHHVHSGIALVVRPDRPPDLAAARTEVVFRALAEEEIAWYLATGEWAGAAGAYRIQDRGAFLVAGIQGSWSNIVGLPLELFYGMLRRNGYPF
jgi:septum formation protein